MVRHHGSEDNTLGPDDCKAYGLGPVANTDSKLLIYGLFQKGRVLAQDGRGVVRRPRTEQRLTHQGQPTMQARRTILTCGMMRLLQTLRIVV